VEIKLYGKWWTTTYFRVGAENDTTVGKRLESYTSPRDRRRASPLVWYSHGVPPHRQVASHGLGRWLLPFVAVQWHAAIRLHHTHTHTLFISNALCQCVLQCPKRWYTFWIYLNSNTHALKVQIFYYNACCNAVTWRILVFHSMRVSFECVCVCVCVFMRVWS